MIAFEQLIDDGSPQALAEGVELYRGDLLAGCEVPDTPFDDWLRGEDGADSLAQILRLSNHEVEVSHSGADALEVLSAFRPQVVLLDIGLPGMDGFETARRMRAQDDGSRLVLIAISGYGSEEHRARARQAGFDDYLIKPPNVTSLLGILARLPAD